MKSAVLLLLLVLPLQAAQPRWECVRWTWTGDIYNRKVICLEWRDKTPKQEKQKGNKK
jgi:hypothetical protein